MTGEADHLRPPPPGGPRRAGRPLPPPEVPRQDPRPSGETPATGAAAGEEAAADAPRGTTSAPPGPARGAREVYTPQHGWVTQQVEVSPACPSPDAPPAGLPLETRGPLRGEAAWGWKYGLAGLAVGFGPEMLLYAVSLGAVSADTKDTTVTAASAVALVIISLLVYAWHTAAAWFFSVRVAGGRLSAWGFRLPTRAYFWTIPAALALVYAVSIVHDLVVDPEVQDIVGEFPHTALGVVLFVLLAVIIAPLFEEVFFRGFLFRAFASSWGWVTGAVVSSAVFGVAHAQFDVFVPLFALGLMLAWVYKRTGSLWTSISLHALFNGLSVLVWAVGG